MSTDEKTVNWYVPITPGDTACIWLASKTEDEAWAQLMENASYMPYPDKAAFIERGYTVECWDMPEDWTP